MTHEHIDRVRARAAASAEVDSQQAAPTAQEHWRSVLGGMSPREILARLLQGDPLGLRNVVAARLASRAYLFDADRVHLRALAHCARYGVRYRGTPPLETWLEEIVDQALLDLLREDADAERRGVAADAEELAAFVDLARPLGLEPATMRRVCLAHNLLREPERRAFHGLVIARRTLEDVARSLGQSGVEVARLARRGLEAVLIAAGQAAEQPARETKAAHGSAGELARSKHKPSADRSPSTDEVQP
jgi:DNA-directed RNA polymerase specialized sigma24 family protein